MLFFVIIVLYVQAIKQMTHFSDVYMLHKVPMRYVSHECLSLYRKNTQTLDDAVFYVDIFFHRETGYGTNTYWIRKCFGNPQ